MSNKLAELLAKRRLLQDEADERGEGYYMTQDIEKPTKLGSSPRLSSDDIASAWDNMRRPLNSIGEAKVASPSVASPSSTKNQGARPLPADDHTPLLSEKSPVLSSSSTDTVLQNELGQSSDEHETAPIPNGSEIEKPPIEIKAVIEVAESVPEDFNISSSTIVSPRLSESNLGTGRYSAAFFDVRLLCPTTNRILQSLQ